MSDELFQKTLSLPVSLPEAFAYHERPGALSRLTPPWESVRVVSSDNSLTPGSRVVLELKRFGLRLRWVAEHTEYDPPHSFVDRQVSGPFASWVHEHLFKATEFVSAEGIAAGHVSAGDSSEGAIQGDQAAGAIDSCELTDRIHYRVPFGRLGHRLGGSMVRKQLQQMFAYRHAITHADLRSVKENLMSPKRIAVSGGSGLVGSQLIAFLRLAGHEVLRIVRSPTDDPTEVAAWDSETEARKLDGCDAVVHLAGESIAGGRWTAEKKSRIRSSRVDKTHDLCELLSGLSDPPKTLLCASATGIYGDRGDESLTEQSAVGDDFLAEVATAWEDACQPARDAGLRVVNMRFGIILSKRGGALQKMLLPARLAGGRLGNGKQWWSWIELQDVIRGIYHCLAHESVRGPVNFVAPEPTRNQEFVNCLGSVLGIPALVPAPKFGLRLALGEMADALLLASVRAEPTVLEQTNFQFEHPTLESALRFCLGKQLLEAHSADASA